MNAIFPFTVPTSSPISPSPQTPPRAPRQQPPVWLLFAHYWMPVLSGWSAAAVVQQSNGMAFSPSGLTFLLASIAAAYGWDRVWERPEGEARWVRRAILAVTLISAVTGGLALLAMPGAALEMSLLLAGVTVAYPWLKRLPLLKNFLVALVWVMAATFFPFIPEHGALGWWFDHWLSWNATVPLFILWTAACLLCDLKDEEEDRKSGVRSLPALYGTRGACLVAAGMVLLSGAIALGAERPGLALASGVMLALCALPSLLKQKALGPLLVDATLAIPGALILMLVS